MTAAVIDRLRPRSLTFKVTPKSHDSLAPLPLRLVMPYQSITLVLASAAVAGELTGPAYGYVFLCILGASTYAVVTVAVCCLHAFETAKAVGVDRISAFVTVRVPLAITMLTMVPLAFAISIYPRYLLGFIQI